MSVVSLCLWNRPFLRLEFAIIGFYERITSLTTREDTPRTRRKFHWTLINLRVPAIKVSARKRWVINDVLAPSFCTILPQESFISVHSSSNTNLLTVVASWAPCEHQRPVSCRMTSSDKCLRRTARNTSLLRFLAASSPEEKISPIRKCRDVFATPSRVLQTRRVCFVKPMVKGTGGGIFTMEKTRPKFARLRDELSDENEIIPNWSKKVKLFEKSWALFSQNCDFSGMLGIFSWRSKRRVRSVLRVWK